MKALILYWSVNGTTKRVAESIAEGLRSAGAECVMHDLRAGAPSELETYDLLGVGFPVHWYRPPTPVSRAIAALAPLGGRSVFAFSLNGTYRGAALNRARSALVRAGGTEIGAFASYGEDNVHLYTREGWLLSPGHPTEPELEAAQRFGTAMVERHRRRRAGEALPLSRPRDPRTHALYALERLVTGPRLTRILYSRLFRVDPVRCTSCGKCARRCPTGNIAWERGTVPRWGRDCVLCLDCVNTCPEEAVSCPFDWAIFRPIMRLNVNRALHDPDLDREPVVHRKGRLERA